MNSPNRLEIRLDRLDENLRALRAFVGDDCEICPVLKADAYGLGAVRIARRLADNGVTLQAVYCPDQARPIIDAGVDTSLLILTPIESIDDDDYSLRQALAEGRLHLAGHTLDQLRRLDELGRSLATRIAIHLELDTGMNRVGMTPAQAGLALRALDSLPNLQLVAIFTHTAAADDDAEFTEAQFERFTRFLAEHKEWIPLTARPHFAATCATLRNARYHGSMIRPGLALLGYGLEQIEDTVSGDRLDLKPVARLVSRIVHVRHVPPNSPVGYNHLFFTHRPTWLGIVPLGYADGYPLSLSNRGAVRVGPNRLVAPQVGYVNMDQIIIDLTELIPGLPESDTFRPADLPCGDTVELISDDDSSPNSLPRLAQLADSITYEMLCRINPRVPRVYLEGPASIEPQSPSAGFRLQAYVESPVKSGVAH